MQNDASLADVCFVDRSTGWAVGDRGVIWHTADGGQNVAVADVGRHVPPHVGVVSRSSGTAGRPAERRSPIRTPRAASCSRRTTAARPGPSSPQATLPAIARMKFFDAEHGIAAGDGNPLVSLRRVHRPATAAEPGSRCQPTPAASGSPPISRTSETGAVAGPAGRFATLMRRRVVHSPSAVSNSRAYRALRLAPPTGGWLVGDGGLVMTTHDLGNSWQTPPGDLPQFVTREFRLSTPSRSRDRTCGSPARPARGCFTRPTAGRRWQPFATGQNAPLRAIAFVDANTGWAVGDLGTILATADGGRTWQVQRRGGERAALLAVFARETDVPLELVAKLGAEEGYLTAVNLLHPAADATDAIHEAMLLRRCHGDRPGVAIPAAARRRGTIAGRLAGRAQSRRTTAAPSSSSTVTWCASCGCGGRRSSSRIRRRSRSAIRGRR